MTSRHLVHVARTAIVIAAVSPLFAAQAQIDTVRRDSTRVQLTPVVVQGARQSATVGGASAVVLPLDSLRLTPGAPLADVLREMPFVLVRQNSRGEVEVSVRGSDSRQAAILFDGLPMTLGWDSRADPSILPISGAGSIVLVRGLSTLLQGPNTLGGVLELGVVSNRTTAPERTQLGLRFGVDQVGGKAGQVDGVRAFLGGHGEFTVRGGAGWRDRPAVALAGNLTDPFSHDERRANSDLEQADGYLAVRYARPGGAWVGSVVSAYQATRGVMPELHVQAPRFWRYPDQRRQMALVSAGTGRRRTALGSGDMELVVGVNRASTAIQNFRDASYDSVTATEDGDEQVVTTRLFADHSLGRGEIRSSFTLAQVDYDEVLDRAAPNRYAQRLWSTAVEVDQPVTGTWRVTAGVARDVSETPASGGKPSLGTLAEWGGRLGVTTLAFDQRWRLHASASRRARFAALRELYSGALNRFEPNPTLRPEVLTGGEVGGSLLSSRVQFQVVAFRQHLRDAVVRITQPDRRFKRVNRDRIISTGLELLGGTAIGRAQVTADAMLQRVRLEDPAVQGSDRRPENQPAFRAGLDATMPGWRGVQLRGGVTHTGDQTCVHPDRGANVRLAPQTLANAGVDRTFAVRSAGLWRGVRVGLHLDNATNRAVFEQCGLPMPGRTLRLSVELH